ADPIWYGLAIDANTGVLQWRHEWQISDPNQGVIRSLTFDDGGDIFLAGYSIPGTMSFGGPTIQVGPPPGGWSQGFVVHLDPNGEWVAGNTFCDQCIPWKIALGPGGEIIVAGIVNFYQLGNIPTPPGNNDRGVFRLDASTFQPMWAKFMNEIPDIAIGIDGQIGFSFGSEDIYLDGAAPLGIGTRDLIIGKITMNGTIPWYRLFGAPGAVLDDIGLQTYRAQPDGKAIVYITASGPPVDFGFGPMTFPSSNVALMQIAP
ncbi:MAG: hypothetical protein JNK04_07945, partial [Myxococcales bacterium]|nr:hypothetical protein [Myxococcales bacterium]